MEIISRAGKTSCGSTAARYRFMFSIPILFASLSIAMHPDRKINIVLFGVPEIVFIFSGISSLIVFNIPKFYYESLWPYSNRKSRCRPV